MDNYQDTIKYLYSLQYSGIKLGLKNITGLLAFLGNPQKKWPAIHIAGTNGKGSTAVFIYSILKESGYRVGLYTSPHLIDFSERIRINDKCISWDTIVGYTRQLLPQIEKYKSTFFEATTAIAFQYFAENNVDIAVVETGLGGRLDATNMVEPLVTVITPISLDHQQYLGNDILKITREKGGIIKSGVPCITNNTNPDIIQILRESCKEKNTPFQNIDSKKNVRINGFSLNGSLFDFDFSENRLSKLKISMGGIHQPANAALAVASVYHLGDFNISERFIRSGLKKASWPGRLQIIQKRPLVILDVAHNPAGFESILGFLKQLQPQKKVWVIIGLAKDKDYRTIADILEKRVDYIGIVSNFSDRGLPAEKLISAFRQNSKLIHKFENVTEAYNRIMEQIPKDEILLIIGSHYLAGEFLQKLQIS